jgi:tetratricopeptide (TPR) repeat protein
MATGPDLIEQAIQSFRAGNKQQAARTLALLIKNEPANEQAWWWLAACVDSIGQKTDCYQRILRINPLHAGARTALLDLQANQPPPEPDSSAVGMVDPSNAPTARLSPTGVIAHLSLLANRPVEPEVENLMALAAQAEAGEDFQSGYDLYSRAVAIDSSYAPAWLGKGYTAGRLSTPEYNGIPEFFTCLTRAVLSQDRLGLTLPQALSQLDPALARVLVERLRDLSSAIARLAVTSSLSMRNVFAIERVRLADCSFAVSRRMKAQSGLAGEYADLAEIALDAFRHIIAGVRASTRGALARHELVQNFRALLLNNLEASGLKHDPEFLRQVNSLAENL